MKVRPSFETVVPAPSGWFTLSRWNDDKTGETGYHRSPVVAFRIESFTDRSHGSIVSAIDPMGDEDGTLQSPSGEVWCPVDGLFPTADAWFAGREGAEPVPDDEPVPELAADAAVHEGGTLPPRVAELEGQLRLLSQTREARLVAGGCRVFLVPDHGFDQLRVYAATDPAADEYADQLELLGEGYEVPPEYYVAVSTGPDAPLRISFVFPAEDDSA